MVRSTLPRRALAAFLPALFVALGIGAPLLDRAGADREVRYESRHDPGTCPTVHDHTLCTQLGHEASLAASRPAVALPRTVSSFIAPAAPSSRRTQDRRDGPPSRAPPRIGSTRP